MMQVVQIVAKKRPMGYWARLKVRFNKRPKYVFVHTKWYVDVDRQNEIFCGEEVLELFPRSS